VFEQEPGASGKLLAADIVRRLAGWDVHGISATGDKVTRAMPFLAQAQAGNVRLVQGPWIGEWLDEICAFPMGSHDDQVDSASGAFAALTTDLYPTEDTVVYDDRYEISTI
jgi:predicted phage terminase large subunit-like protein